MKEKAGIVLSGGGGKGAYQIGVWKALDKLGVCKRITGVSGASVGALNGAMFCTGKLGSAVRAWSSISEGMILQPNDLSDHVVKKYCNGILYHGWFSNDGLKEIIDQYADLSRIPDSKVVFYAAASRVTKPAIFSRYVKAISSKNLISKIIAAFSIGMLPKTTTVRYFRVNDYTETTIENILLASSAIPFVFPDIRIGGDVYVDGGLNDNVPILPLYQDEFRKILVVSLNSEYQVPTWKYPGAKFLQLTMQEESKIKRLTGTFDFMAEDARRRMKAGYENCMDREAEILDFFN